MMMLDAALQGDRSDRRTQQDQTSVHGTHLRAAFDSQRGVHVVVGWEDVFYHRDRFYRVIDGNWQISLQLDGG